MNEDAVEIPEQPYTGGPFVVGDALTLYEAAMVYSERHPGGQFVDGTKDYERAEIEDYELYLGKNVREGPGKLAWDIYCQLRKMVATAEIKPIKAAYTPSGEIDPRDTKIATADIVKLARARGETPHFLSLWKSRQVPAPSRPRGRVRSKYDTAVTRIERAFPDGKIPPLAEMSHGKLYQLVTKSDGATPAFSLDTCTRVRRTWR
jgi:hypothetical protein